MAAVATRFDRFEHNPNKKGSLRAWLYGVTRNKLSDWFENHRDEFADQCVPSLLSMKSLHFLDVRDTAITEAGLLALMKHRGLDGILMSGIEVSAEAAAKLRADSRFQGLTDTDESEDKADSQPADTCLATLMGCGQGLKFGWYGLNDSP